MTSTFILERAKVLAFMQLPRVYETAEELWDEMHHDFRYNYTAMAQALTDAETAKGWKVVEREPTFEMQTAIFSFISPELTEDDAVVSWRKAFDAAPAWPGGEK